MRLREPARAVQWQPERWRRNQGVSINTSWFHPWVSGWLSLAGVGSRKRITNTDAKNRPLRHHVQRCGPDGSGPHLLHLPYTVLPPYRPAVLPPYVLLCPSVQTCCTPSVRTLVPAVHWSLPYTVRPYTGPCRTDLLYTPYNTDLLYTPYNTDQRQPVTPTTDQRQPVTPEQAPTAAARRTLFAAVHFCTFRLFLAVCRKYPGYSSWLSQSVGPGTSSGQGPTMVICGYLVGTPGYPCRTYLRDARTRSVHTGVAHLEGRYTMKQVGLATWVD